MSVRVALLLSAVCLCAALTVKSSPEARFLSTEVDVSVERFPASVLSDGAYAALKHEEATKAVRGLHLEGESSADMLAELGIDNAAEEGELSEGDSEEELLTLAAESESGAEDSADAEETAEDSQALEAEIEAVEAEADSEEVSFLEASEETEEEEESEDEAEDESEEEETDEESDEEEAEEEEETESEDEEEADSEDESEEEESEDLALIEEAGAPAVSGYMSPELRPALPSKHNDAMPDKTYDNVAEKNLFPKAAYEIGVGPKPKWMKKAKKGKGKGKKSPKPAAKGKKGKKAAKKARKAKKAKKAAKKAARKARKAARKAAKKHHKKHGKKHGKRHGKKHGKHAGKKHRKHGKKHGRKSRKGKKSTDPKKIITAPYLQDIWDARHKQFVASTNDLLNEVDDGILEHMVYPKIADPNKKHCKKKGAKKL